MKIALKYPEAAFFLQLRSKQVYFDESVREKLDQIKEIYPSDALAINERSMTAKILPILDIKLIIWKKILTSLREDITLEPSEKEEMETIYELLLRKTKEMKVSLLFE